MYGAILLLGVTLTLPGFAGLILTIGVAADANVVIFERIKEEARAGKIGARGDRGRLREGLPHDRRRERRHGDHRADPVRGRDRRGQGLRADAADRHRGLAGHRRRGDARDARPARGLPLVRQPELHGGDRSAGSQVPADRLHAPPQHLVRDLRRRDPGQPASRSASGASTSASTSRAASRSRSRRRATSLSDVRAQTPAIGRSDAIVQGRGTSTTAARTTRTSRSGSRS